MYTVQSLWTMAREGLTIKTIICNNAGYPDRRSRDGSGRGDELGERARSLVDLSSPEIDWVSLAKGSEFRLPGSLRPTSWPRFFGAKSVSRGLT
jgi:thiamine pyrophosphate-dependent acetolactate synthase large subunit-like protein